MLHRTQEVSCLLNPFPTSGKKCLFILGLRFEGSQKWRLDAMLEITSCVFSFWLEPWVDFSIQLCQWGNVLLFLEFLDSLPIMWLCLNAFWGNVSPPCLNTEHFIIVDSEDWKLSFLIIISPSLHDSPFRWSQSMKGISHFVFLESFFHGEVHRITLDVHKLRGSEMCPGS